MITGSCLCGDIAWEVAQQPAWMTHCHCSLCRKAHGTAFSTFVGVPASAFRFTRGEASVRGFASSSALERTFCPRCGSKLPVRWQDEVQMPAASLDGALGAKPSKHIFVASKAPWHEIRDALPQHAGSGSSDPEFPTRRHSEPAPGVSRGACLCGAVGFEIDTPLTGATRAVTARAARRAAPRMRRTRSSRSRTSAGCAARSVCAPTRFRRRSALRSSSAPIAAARSRA